MLIKSKLARIAARVSLLGPLVFASAAASAADLPCVQRAIDWKNGGGTHELLFTTVALHRTGIAAFASGVLVTSKCSGPWGIGEFDCLASSDYSDALLSNRFHSEPSDGQSFPISQPFDVHNPLPLIIRRIPPDSAGQVRLQQPNATYDFHPQCVGDMFTGDDQYGNHWTMSFQFVQGPR
jgi:hypothetical protein